MNGKEFATLAMRHVEMARHRDLTAVIQVTSQGEIGGTPCVPVLHVGAGIDWDRGKLMIAPDRPLTTLTAEDVKAIHESVQKGQSWHAYQDWKKARDRIRDLEAELAKLKGGV